MAIKKEKGAVKSSNAKSKAVQIPKTRTKKTEVSQVKIRANKASKVQVAKELTGEEYLAENLELLTKISSETGKTIEMLSMEIDRMKANRASLNALTISARQAADSIDYLTQKLGSVASHVVALEIVLSEIAPKANLNMKDVVAKIRKKIADGTDGKGDAAKAIDVATRLISKD